MTHDEFKIAAFLACEYTTEMPDWADSPISEIVETHEPISNFRPVDVMSGKAAGEESVTKFGPVVIRRGVQKAKGQPRQTMFLASGEDGVTLVGWTQ